MKNDVKLSLSESDFRKKLPSIHSSFGNFPHSLDSNLIISKGLSDSEVSLDKTNILNKIELINDPLISPYIFFS